jgi:hypothetical protein
MAEQQKTKEKAKKRGRPRKQLVPHQLSKELDTPKYQVYRELYYTSDNQLLPLGLVLNSL